MLRVVIRATRHDASASSPLAGPTPKIRTRLYSVSASSRSTGRRSLPCVRDGDEQDPRRGHILCRRFVKNCSRSQFIFAQPYHNPEDLSILVHRRPCPGQSHSRRSVYEVVMLLPWHTRLSGCVSKGPPEELLKVRLRHSDGARQLRRSDSVLADISPETLITASR